MFKMFGFGGVKCPRCEHRNGDTSDYCSHCGLSLGAPRNAPVLRDNRWIPDNDELAVFFGVRQLSGIFSKTLHVPAATALSSCRANRFPRCRRASMNWTAFSPAWASCCATSRVKS